MYGVLLTSVSLADLGQCESIWNHMVGCERHKNPLFDGVGLVPVGGFSVLGGGKESEDGLALVGAFLQSHKDTGWTGLAHGR